MKILWASAFFVAASCISCSGAPSGEPLPIPKPLPQPAPLVEEAVGDRQFFFIGHSLLSDVPDMIFALTKERGATYAWKEQNVPGAPLHWQWNAGIEGKQQMEPQFQALYPAGITASTTDLVVTDSVPRGGKDQEQETIDSLRKFRQHFMQKNPKGKLWYYETWHCADSGTPKGCAYDTVSPTRTLPWRERLDADKAMWRRIAKEGGAEVIPVGAALGVLTDTIAKGEVPGLKGFRDLFDDDIHLNPYGKYFVGLVQYAALFKKDPRGLGSDVKDRWGRSYWNTPNWQKKQWPPLKPGAAAKMQEAAWKAVCAEYGWPLDQKQ